MNALPKVSRFLLVTTSSGQEILKIWKRQPIMVVKYE